MRSKCTAEQNGLGQLDLVHVIRQRIVYPQTLMPARVPFVSLVSGLAVVCVCVCPVKHKVHHKMLTDKVRMQAYAAAVEQNKHLFKDKYVMDIGAGTGVLSMLAAKAGAKRVFAVEASGMAGVCREIVAENGSPTCVHRHKSRSRSPRVPELHSVCARVCLSCTVCVPACA